MSGSWGGYQGGGNARAADSWQPNLDMSRSSGGKNGGKGGQNGGYSNGGKGAQNGGYSNGGRPDPFGAAGGSAGSRATPFGAAGPANNRAGAGGAFGANDFPEIGAALEKQKYVPPAMRGIAPEPAPVQAANWGRNGNEANNRGGKNGFDDHRGGKSNFEADQRGGKKGGKNGFDADYDRGGKNGGKNGFDDHRGGKNGYDDDHRGGKNDRGGKNGFDAHPRGGKNSFEDEPRGGKADSGKGKNSGKSPAQQLMLDSKGSTGGKGGDGGKAERRGGKADSEAGKANGKASSKSEGGKAGGKSEGGNASGGKASGKSEGGKAKGKGKAAQEESAPAPKVTSATKKSGGSGAVTSSHLSQTKFANLDMSAETKRAMAEGFGYEMCTEVQAQAIPPMLKGMDVVARARTGTGKTIAFMIPTIECLREWPAGVGGNISALVLSPTRELAQQIHDETEVLLGYHGNLGVLCFYGGTNIKGDHRDLANKRCDILVATPGRMQDHLDNTPNFAKRISELSFLVLDEADQLLETGFRDAILKILKYLPAPKLRQGALFSATFPPAVSEIAKLALRPDHNWINTVTDEVTPDQIAQSCCVTDIDNMTETLWGALSSEMARHPKTYKIMVFFVAARVTQLYSEMFNAAGLAVHEIHSRKSQGHRTKAAETFRSETRGIVFSSDVLARGLDFPDVTAVIQVGVPSARDQYIHRLGRTGRAGKSGGCILLLHDFESYFLKVLSDLPVKKLSGSRPFPDAKPAPDGLWWPPVAKTGCQAYQAWLGYYNSAKGLGWKKEILVQQAYRFAESISAIQEDGQPPPIMKKTVGKMGLKGVPGLNLVNVLAYED